MSKESRKKRRLAEKQRVSDVSPPDKQRIDPVGITGNANDERGNLAPLSIAESQPNAAPTVSKKEEPKDRRDDALDKKRYRVELSALAAGLVALVVYYLQWEAASFQAKLTNQQLALARQSFETDQRAWETPDEVTTEPAQDGQTRFKVFFKNTGKTPAMNCGPTFGFTIDPKTISDADPYTGSPFGLIAPNGVIHVSFPIISSSTNLFFFGTVWYSDIFGKKHWTQFCYEYTKDLQLIGPSTRHNNCDDCNPIKPDSETKSAR